MKKSKLIGEALTVFKDNQAVIKSEFEAAKREYGNHEHGFPRCFPWSACHELGKRVVALSQRADMYDEAVRGLRGGITTPAVEALDTVIIPDVKASLPDPHDSMSHVLFDNPYRLYENIVKMRDNLAAVAPQGLTTRK